MDNLTIVQEQANTFVIGGATFKLVNEISVEAMAKMEQIISINEQDIPIPQYMFDRLGRGHCGGAWAISPDHVLKVNETHNRASINMERFVDGECLEALQGLPMTPKLYAYSDCKKYMVVERLYGMQTGEAKRDIKQFTAKMGVSILPQTFDWKGYIDQIHEFTRGSIQRGWQPKDLHDENLMLTREGKVVIVDYGLFTKLDSNYYGGVERWRLDSEIEGMEGQVRKLAREIIDGLSYGDSYKYEATNPVNYAEFLKPIEKEAEEIVKRYSLAAHLDMEGYDLSNIKEEAKFMDFLKVIDKPMKIEIHEPVFIDWGHHRGSIRHIGAAKQAFRPVAPAALFQDIRPPVSFHLNDGGVIRELKSLQFKPVEPMKFPKFEFDVDNAVKQLEKAAGGFKALFQNIKGGKNNELF